MTEFASGIIVAALLARKALWLAAPTKASL
jgi:hypothetical protein